MRAAPVVSFWPGYVAAVASLVLSLLLLSGVMVIAVTQVGQLVSAYNEDLMVAVLEDELRTIELEKLQTMAQQAQKQLAQPSRPPAPSAAPAAPDAQTRQRQAEQERQAAQERQAEQERQRLQRLQEQIAQRQRDIALLDQELARVQSDLRLSASTPADVKRHSYRFVFGPGVSGLTEAVMSQLAQQIQADALNPSLQSWALEAGVMGLDPSANREVYRLMLNTRKQLQSLGFDSSRVQVVLNTAARPQSLMRDGAVLTPGEIPMLLSSGLKQGGG